MEQIKVFYDRTRLMPPSTRLLTHEKGCCCQPLTIVLPAEKSQSGKTLGKLGGEERGFENVRINFPYFCFVVTSMSTRQTDIQHTVIIEPDLFALLEEESSVEHRGTTEIVNDLLRRQLLLKKIKEFEDYITPLAREKGYLTDEDIFNEVS